MYNHISKCCVNTFVNKSSKRLWRRLRLVDKSVNQSKERAFYMVLMVLFWILLILLAIGAFIPDASVPGGNRARWAIVLILIGILGWAVFGGIERPSRRSELPQTTQPV